MRAPDGTTILITTGPTMYLLPMVEAKPSFDHARDFVPVSLLGAFRVRRGRPVPATDAKDFRSSSPGSRPIRPKSSFGVPSNGTIPHFTGSRLETVARHPDDARALSRRRADREGPGRRTSAVRGRHRCRRDRASIAPAPCALLAVEQREALAVPARCADAEGERRRSRGRRLVRHVAAGRQLAGFRQAIERGRGDGRSPSRR